MGDKDPALSAAGHAGRRRHGQRCGRGAGSGRRLGIDDRHRGGVDRHAGVPSADTPYAHEIEHLPDLLFGCIAACRGAEDRLAGIAIGRIAAVPLILDLIAAGRLGLYGQGLALARDQSGSRALRRDGRRGDLALLHRDLGRFGQHIVAVAVDKLGPHKAAVHRIRDRKQLQLLHLDSAHLQAGKGVNRLLALPDGLTVGADDLPDKALIALGTGNEGGVIALRNGLAVGRLGDFDQLAPLLRKSGGRERDGKQHRQEQCKQKGSCFFHRASPSSDALDTAAKRGHTLLLYSIKQPGKNSKGNRLTRLPPAAPGSPRQRRAAPGRNRSEACQAPSPRPPAPARR